MKINFKKCIPDVLCIVLFVLISVAYFYPADFEGRRLEGGDHTGGLGLGTELNAFKETHNGEQSRWTNAVFGGMPTYQMAPSYQSTNILSAIGDIYHLWLPDYVFYIFISMLGFYILLRAFDFKQWMAALGAIIWAFSSYFFIIIAAGHIWKVLTLAYIPPTIAGMVMCYKGKYLWGGVVAALFGALQIMSNHVQMSYYFLFAILFMVIAYLIDAIRNGKMTNFLKATLSLAIAAALAVAINISNLYHTYEYSKETMRGKSELVKEGKTEDQTDSGLERSYITNWSYGKSETWSLLVPNVNGGASVPLSASKTAMRKADPQFNQMRLYDYFTQYWGDQPGTSGPVYVGAFVCLLFVLSLLVIPNKNPLKWALLAATILSFLLAWGRNLMWFTNLFIDYVPMYSKFRTVSSALVVAEFTIPLLAMMGLKEFIEKMDDEEKRSGLLTKLGISTIVTGGFALLFAFWPSIFGGGTNASDANTVEQLVGYGFPEMQTGMLMDSLKKMRYALLTSDAWRSVILILIGAALMYIYGMKKRQITATTLVICLTALCLYDLWSVNKRYLNDQMFVRPNLQKYANPSEADTFILEADKDVKDYRVLSFNNPFNDNSVSNFHFSVGGYHPAKLRRYQELIETHISDEMRNVYKALGEAQSDTVALYALQDGMHEMLTLVDGAKCDSLFPVLNMLNTRWFLLNSQDGGQLPMRNPYAYGNAWLVKSVKYVDNANEEIEKTGLLSPREVAVVDKSFKSALGDMETLNTDSADQVALTLYDTNHLEYKVNTKHGGVVVFSEIYYPEWTATIDGQPAEIGRADYVLRCMKVPAGEHQVVMTFAPKSIEQTEAVANVSFVLLLLAVATGVFFAYKRRRDSKVVMQE